RRTVAAFQLRHVLRAYRRAAEGGETLAPGARLTAGGQPRAAEPCTRRGAFRALRRSAADRQRRTVTRPGGGQRRLPEADAGAAELLAEAEDAADRLTGLPFLLFHR